MTKHAARTAIDAADASRRVRRAVVAGALVSFLGFFGLAMVATPPSLATNGSTPVISRDVVTTLVKTHVRTRTS